MDAFLAAASELPDKMLLCGHPDYPVFCENLKQSIIDRRMRGGVLPDEAAYIAGKAEQEGPASLSCQAAR